MTTPEELNEWFQQANSLLSKARSEEGLTLEEETRADALIDQAEAMLRPHLLVP